MSGGRNVGDWVVDVAERFFATRGGRDGLMMVDRSSRPWAHNGSRPSPKPTPQRKDDFPDPWRVRLISRGGRVLAVGVFFLNEPAREFSVDMRVIGGGTAYEWQALTPEGNLFVTHRIVSPVQVVDDGTRLTLFMPAFALAFGREVVTPDLPFTIEDGAVIMNLDPT